MLPPHAAAGSPVAARPRRRTATQGWEFSTYALHARQMATAPRARLWQVAHKSSSSAARAEEHRSDFGVSEDLLQFVSVDKSLLKKY